MSWNGTASHWQYSRWVYAIGRNMYATLPQGAEVTAVKTFLKAIWNPMTQTGTRPWLQSTFQRRAVQVPGDTDYQCDIDQQPNHVLVELLNNVGRDLKKLPMTAGEKTLADAFIASTGNRRYGTSLYYGSVGGSIVTIV